MFKTWISAGALKNDHEAKTSRQKPTESQRSESQSWVQKFSKKNKHSIQELEFWVKF